MNRHTRSNDEPLSLFAFLSVVTCSIGALLVVLV